MFQSTKAVKTIFYINITMFILQLLSQGIITNYLSMYDMDEPLFKPYQLITYQFLHAGVLHILFNMLVLLSFGPSVENIYGEKRMWMYYLLCGVSGAVLHSLLMNSGDIPMLGASASIWGIMILFTLEYPEQKLYLFLMPFGIKGKYIIGLMFLFELASAFKNDGVAHLGHIGGALMGLSIFLLHKFKILK